MKNRRDGFKGVLLNGYGVYSNAGADAIISSLVDEQEFNALDNCRI